MLHVGVVSLAQGVDSMARILAGPGTFVVCVAWTFVGCVLPGHSWYACHLDIHGMRVAWTFMVCVLPGHSWYAAADCLGRFLL